MKSNLEQMNIVITKHTAEALRNDEKVTGLSIGEIIDRLLLKTTIYNSNFAATCICDYVILITRDQTNTQIEETILKTVALLLTAYAESHDYTFEHVMFLLKPVFEGCQDMWEEMNKEGK